MRVPVALIMRLNEKNIEVFRTSDSKNNPYPLLAKEHFFDSGLYCETVIRKDKGLLVENALSDEKWKDNPDIALNMVSYLGFPIKHANAIPFGTLCVLDNHPHKWSKEEENIVLQFRNMIENHLELILALQKVEELNDSLQKVAYFDYLTNIYNRRYFFEIAKETIALSQRNKEIFSIVMIDIDDFKNINDSYGYDFGDKVLQSICRTIEDIIRKSDIFARFGGEEFILLLPNTTQEKALLITEKLRSAVEKISIESVSFTASWGVSQMNLEDSTLDSVIKRADEGLYKAKSSGKNRVCRV